MPVRDRSLYGGKENTERTESRWVFQNGAAYAAQNMVKQPAYSSELSQVVNGTLPVPTNYKTHEEVCKDLRKQDIERQKKAEKTTEYQAKEVSVLIRAILKENFPGVKFSVRTHWVTYSQDVTVKWTDGPSKEEVENLIGHMKAGSFNGMIDLYEYKSAQDNGDGTFVKYGNEYLTLERSYSVDGYTKLRNAVCEEYGLNPADYPVLTYESGEPHCERGEFIFGNADMPTLIWRMAKDFSMYEKPTQKPKAEPKTPTQKQVNNVVYGEFKGHSTIGIVLDNDKTFWIGAATKVKAIVDNIDTLKAWLAEQE